MTADPTPVAGEPQTEADEILAAIGHLEVEPDPIYWSGFRDGKAEAQRLTVERLIDLTEIAAAMLRGEQVCERGHRAGEINAHVHFDQLQRWARRLAALAHPEEEQRP